VVEVGMRDVGMDVDVFGNFTEKRRKRIKRIKRRKEE
jgi:hypothetical protein